MFKIPWRCLSAVQLSSIKKPSGSFLRLWFVCFWDRDSCILVYRFVWVFFVVVVGQTEIHDYCVAMSFLQESAVKLKPVTSHWAVILSWIIIIIYLPRGVWNLISVKKNVICWCMPVKLKRGMGCITKKMIYPAAIWIAN